MGYADDHQALLNGVNSLGEAGHAAYLFLSQGADARIVQNMLVGLIATERPADGDWSAGRLVAIASIVERIVDLDNAHGWYDGGDTHHARRHPGE